MRLSAAPEPLNAAEATSRELVLIDPAVASPEILLEGLRPGLEARLLCADEPAPAQIARAVAGRSLEAVHVIAHGQPGAVAFSGGLLNGQSLAQHQLELEAIGAALGATGQVLLWCCRTAASAAGTAFVEALAQITGVPVAASRSLVGAAARGGSWQLEGGDGSGAAAPLLPAAMASYPGVLITYSQQTGTANPFDGFDVGYVSSPSFADIDADGDLDLVVGDNFGTLYYYRNTGTATAPAYTLQSGTDNPFNGIDVGFSSAPSLADIDGDGDLDLVVGDLFGTLQYYKNTGTATAPVYTLQSGTDNPFNGIDVGSWSKPSFADIDGDGDLDLVLGDKYGSLKYYKNIGSATAPAYTLQSGTANPFDGINFGYYSSPSFADIDGDGDLDLAVGDQQGTLNYYRNTGSATAPAYSLQSGTANPFNGFDVGDYSTPSFADIDGDGDLDLVMGGGYGTLNSFQATSAVAEPIYSEQSGTANPFNGFDVGFSNAPSFADIDGDGDLDLVVGSNYGTLNYYKNTGSANAPAYTLQSGTDNPFNGINVGSHSSPSFADIDGDGDLDLVVGEYYGKLNYYRNTGNATAPAYALQSGTANPFNGIDVGYFSAPSFADIDGDGDLDLVVGEKYGTLYYYKNTGTATAPAYTLQSGTANPFNGIDVGYWSSPSFADIDADGDLDLVVGELYGTLNYRNTGTATAPAYTLQSGTANPFNGFDVGSFSSPSFADIDGDGDLDLAVGDGDGRLNYVLNVVCFLAGTLIATPTGERPIETLQPGDLITTASGPQPVKFISRTTHFAAILDREDLLPIRISRGAFGQLGPVRDLYVSPDHAILLEGHLLQASVLVNGTTITRTSLQHWRHQRDPIEYLNIELEQHQLITAEGLTVESFVDNLPRSDWDNYAAYLSLYGRELPIRELSLPRIKFSRQIPSALRRSLQQLEASVLTRDQPLAASR
jgi:hypothetical protein